MADWTVLREKLRIIHEDPRNRSLEMRMQLRNDGDEPNEDFVMALERFLPGLTLHGPNGEELSYLPTWDIAAKFGSEEAFRNDLADQFGIDPDDLGYALWIVFPEPIEEGQVVTITLEYEDELAPSEGWSFFRSNRFPIDEDKGPEGYDTYVEVQGPPGSRVTDDLGEVGGFEPEAATGAPEERLRAIRLPRFLQTRLPGNYGPVEFNYRLRPLRSEAWLHGTTYMVLTILPLAMIAAVCFGEWDLGGPQNRIGEIVAGLGVTGTLAIMGFIRPTWVNRLWYLLTLAAYLGLLYLTFL